MNARSFAEGFDNDPINYGSLTNEELRSATRSLMEGPSRWSHYFSHLLSAYLLDDPVDSEDVAQNLQTYTSDLSRQLMHSVTTTVENIAFQYESVVSNTNKLNFHTINQEMAPYWLRLINPDRQPAPDYIDISVMQTKLGVHALQLVRTRQLFYEKTLLLAPEPTEEDLSLDSAFAGRITELEAPMAVLQMLKDQPADTRENLILLPGPGKFESGQSINNRASDFILLDREESQATGIQVKTALRGTRKYDPRFVSFIDGVKDLGNYTIRQRTDGSTTRRAQPGLLAADFILHAEELQRQSSYSRIDGLQGMFGRILDAKNFAQTLPEPSDGLTNRTEAASERIRSRLLYALYENETEPDTSSSEDLE